MADQISIPALPFSLTPTGDEWTLEGDVLRGYAPGGTDLFVDPVSGSVNSATLNNAPWLLGTPPEGDFQFTARLRARMASQYDAAVLLAFADDEHWAKFCFEYSPTGQPTVVSVVNVNGCDDANAWTVEADHVRYRIAKVGEALAFHASADGSTWEFVRTFALRADAPLQIGFLAQSPTGEGCEVAFDDIAFTRETLGNLRDGS